jgi:hypothetical protein
MKDVQRKMKATCIESTLPFYIMKPERKCKPIVLKEDASKTAKKRDKDDKKDEDKKRHLIGFILWHGGEVWGPNDT